MGQNKNKKSNRFAPDITVHSVVLSICNLVHNASNKWENQFTI